MDDLKRQFLLEQYKQAAEEYRAEDRNSWWIFAIVLALNGGLAGLLKLDNFPQLSVAVCIPAFVGIASAIGGVFIIARSRRYQWLRVNIAQEIEENISGLKLYYASIDEYMKEKCPNTKLGLFECYSGRKIMMWILGAVAVMWIILIFTAFFYGRVALMDDMKQINLEKITWKDDRGWGFAPFEAASILEKRFCNFHVVSLKPNATRGDHSHTSAIEWLIICGGPAKVAWRATDKNFTTQSFVDGGEPAFFEIPPNVQHAVLNCSQQDIYIISFSNADERGTICCSPLFDSNEKRDYSNNNAL